MSNRTDWTIKKLALWTATHNESGATLAARTKMTIATIRKKEALMSKINEWEVAQCLGTR